MKNHNRSFKKWRDLCTNTVQTPSTSSANTHRRKENVLTCFQPKDGFIVCNILEFPIKTGFNHHTRPDCAQVVITSCTGKKLLSVSLWWLLHFLPLGTISAVTKRIANMTFIIELCRLDLSIGFYVWCFVSQWLCCHETWIKLRGIP